MNYIKVLFLGVFLSLFGSIFGQETTSKGKDFWLGFMAHINGTGSNSANMSLYITSDSATTGTVSIPGQSWSLNFPVGKDSVTVVPIPNTTAYVGCTDCIQNKGIHVTSVLPIAMYAHIYRDYRSDATLVLPTATAGKEYRVMTWSQETNNGSGDVVSKAVFMIVASSDNTKVRITPANSTVQKASGVWAVGTPYNITLNKGEIYQGMAPNRYDDLTGTLIEVIDTGSTASCKKVSVFSGNTGTSLGNCGGLNSKDNLYEQLFPVNSWSTDFLTVPYLGRSNDRYRVLATKDNTVVTINGTLAAILQKGEFYQTGNVNKPQYITSNNPISVAQFMNSQGCGGSRGDPSMTMLSPIQQTLTDIVVYSSQYENIVDNYINIVIKSKDTNTFTMNGSRIPFTAFSTLPAYSYAQRKVSSGNQRLLATGGFNATAYGLGNYESYGYSAGANVTNLAAYISLADKNKKPNNLNTLCLGETAEFTGNADYKVKSWIWDMGDGSKDTGAVINHKYKDTGEYFIKVMVTKLTYDGCSSIDSAMLTAKVVSRPRVNFSFDNACNGKEVKFYDTCVVDQPGAIVFKLWDFGDTKREFGDNPVHLYDTVGKYTANLYLRSTFDCFDTATHVVEMYPDPKAKFAATGSCFKDSLILTDSSSVPLRNIAKRFWDFGDGNNDSSTAKRFAYLYDTSGNFKVTLKVVDEVGCSATTDTIITKHKQFVSGFAFNDACLKSLVQFTDTSKTGGVDPAEKIWYFGDNTNSSAANPAHKYNSDGTYNAKLVLKQNADCSDSTTQAVKIFKQVQSSSTALNLCYGDSGTLTHAYVPGTETLSKIGWYFSSDSFFGKNVKVMFPDSGKYTYKLITTTSNNCKDTLDSNIYIIPRPKADFTSNTICLNQNAVMTDASNSYGYGINNYAWKSKNSSAGNVSVFSYPTSQKGIDSVKLIVTSGAGCRDSITKSVFVWSLPLIDISGTNACLGKPITITNNSTIDTGTINAWAWTEGNGNTSAMKTPTPTYVTDGIKKLVLTATSDKGCVKKDSINIEVFPLPKMDFTVTEDCEGLPTIFTNNSTVTKGSIVNLAWDFGDGNSSTISNPQNTYAVPSTYNVNLSGTTDSGCIGAITKTAVVHEIPVVDFTASPLQGCMPLNVNFTNTSTIGTDVMAVFSWNANGIGIGTTENLKHTFTNPGKYSITYSVESDFGCFDEITVDSLITVFDKPVADFSYLPKVPTIIESLVTFTDLSQRAASWQWNFGDGGTDNIPNPVHNYKDTGTYIISLIVSNSNGCQDEKKKSVFIEPAFSVFVPSSFSPNGDGLNEEFKLGGVLQGVKGYELEIFNRWGEILFSTKDVNKGWDGTYMGKPVPEGLYHYRMRYTDYFVSQWVVNNNFVYLIR